MLLVVNSMKRDDEKFLLISTGIELFFVLIMMFPKEMSKQHFQLCLKGFQMFFCDFCRHAT